jgi:hypothetical protein
VRPSLSCMRTIRTAKFGPVLRRGAFPLEQKDNVLRLPTTALFFGPRGIEVALLTSDGRLNMSKVELGRNLGSEVEVLSRRDGKAIGRMVIGASPANACSKCSPANGLAAAIVQETSARPTGSGEKIYNDCRFPGRRAGDCLWPESVAGTSADDVR